jgi:hypothetical protein
MGAGWLSSCHFPLDPLDCAGAKPKCFGGSQDAHTLPQFSQYLVLDVATDLRPSEFPSLGNGTLQAEPDPLPNHRPFKFGERTANLEH